MTNIDPDDDLGLDAGTVRLANYDPRWPALFRAEAERILEALGPLARAVEHYGSTSVPGLAAKPILDILVGTDQFGDPGPFTARLEPLGYEYAHWAGVPDHQVFGRGAPRSHLLHLVQFDGSSWRDALRFRDRLRTDATQRQAYAAVKLELATRYPTDRPRYTAEKGAFIEGVVSSHGQDSLP
ncbi:MAG: GrpB family protein [Gemmatimonadaceae bacterium]|nr:GrpB family protein [Gemmatimonadaceae bacterium]